MAYESRLSITIDSRTAEQKAQDLQSALQLLENAGIRLTNTNQKVSSTSKAAGSAMGEAGNQANKGTSGVNRLNKSLRDTDTGAAQLAATIRRSLIGAFAGISTINVYKSVTDNLKAYQDMRTRLTQLVGTSQQYQKEEEYLIQLSKDHHKELIPLADSYVRLIALQKQGIITTEEARKITEGFSNAQSALGITTEQQGFILYGLSQALSQGTVQAQELNQVIEPMPGLLDALGRAAGFTGKGVGVQFRNMVKEGKVTSDFLKDTLIKALQDYNGAAAATADNLSAKYRDLSNSYQLLVVAFEKPIASTLTPILDSITQATNYFSGEASTLSDGLQTIGKIAGGAAAAGVAFYGTKLAYATQAAITHQLAIANETRTLLLEAQAEQRAAEAIQMSAKQELARANAAVASAEAKVMADKEAQASEIARMRTTQQLMTVENALEVQRMKSQISDIGRQQATARMAEIRLAEVALTKKIEAAERSLAATTTATSVAVQAAYAQRTAAVEAYGIATATVNRAVVQTEKAVAAASLLSRATTALTGFLTGPVGLAISVGLVAASFIDFSDKSKTAKEAAKELSEKVDSLTESFSGLNEVQRQVQVAKFNSQMATIREQINNNNDAIIQLNELVKSTFNESTRFGLINQIDQLKKKNDELEKQLNEISLKQQAVFKSGLPDIKNTTAATDEAAKSTEKLDKSSEKLLQSLRDEYAEVTLGKEALKQYNAEKVIAQIESSKLEGGLKSEALLLVEEIQKRKDAKKALEEQRQAAQEYAAIQQKLAVFQEQQNLSITGMGRGDKWRKQQEQELQVRQQSANAILALEQAQQVESTRISDAAYKQRLTNIQYQESQQIEAIRNAAMQKAAAEQNWMTGSMEALQNYADAAANTYQNVQDATANVLSETTSTISSSLYDLATGAETLGGSLQNMVKGFASSMLQALTDLAAQWLVYQTVQMLVGSTTQALAGSQMFSNAIAAQQMAALNAYASTAAIPLIGPAAAPAAAGLAIAETTPFVTTIASSAFAGLFDSGGNIPSNKWGIVGEYGPEIVSGANVTSRQTTADILKQAGSSSGSPVNVYVSVNPQTGQTEVTGDQTSQYKQLGVMIGNAVRKIIIEEQRPMGLLDSRKR
jgi:lambda family phage tail tape measure protein